MMDNEQQALDKQWPPVRVWLPHGPVQLAAVSPELQNNDGAWWVREDATLTTLKGKRDEWKRLSVDQPGWKQHVRAADELIGLLERADLLQQPASERYGKCQLCHHDGSNMSEGICTFPVLICSDDYHGTRACGCKCVFPTTGARTQQENVCWWTRRAEIGGGYAQSCGKETGFSSGARTCDGCGRRIVYADPAPAVTVEGETQRCSVFKPSTLGVPDEARDRCTLPAGHEGKYSLGAPAVAPSTEDKDDCLGCIASRAGVGRCLVHEPRPSTPTSSEGAVPAHALVRLLCAALERPEAAEGYIRRVIEELQCFPSTGATQVAVEAAAREIAERWIKGELPLEAQVHSLRHLQLQALALHVISKHCADAGEAERLWTQNRQLKAIVDVGTSDDPGTAIAKIRHIEQSARADAIRECVAAIQSLRLDGIGTREVQQQYVAALESLTKKERGNT